MLDLLVYPADLCFRQVFAVAFYPHVWLERSCHKSTRPLSLTMTQSEANEWVLLQRVWSEWLRTGWTTAKREALFLSHASIDWTVAFCFRVGWINLLILKRTEMDWKSESQEFTVYTLGRKGHIIHIIILSYHSSRWAATKCKARVTWLTWLSWASTNAWGRNCESLCWFKSFRSALFKDL